MSEVEFRIGGKATTVIADERDTILDTALRNSISAPYSCLEGVCQTCRAKLVSGEVVGEIEDGYVLTCQVKAKGRARVVVDYDL